MPFDPHDRDYLLDHFQRHGMEVGASIPEEYSAMADAFLAREPVTPSLYECIRRNGMKCRYDSETEEYAVLHAWGMIATYFRPRAAGHLPYGERPEGSHEFATNLEFFKSRCR